MLYLSPLVRPQPARRGSAAGLLGGGVHHQECGAVRDEGGLEHLPWVDWAGVDPALANEVHAMNPMLRVEQQLVHVLCALQFEAAHELVHAAAVLDWIGFGLPVPFQLKADFVPKQVRDGVPPNDTWLARGLNVPRPACSACCRATLSSEDPVGIAAQFIDGHELDIEFRWYPRQRQRTDCDDHAPSDAGGAHRP